MQLSPPLYNKETDIRENVEMLNMQYDDDAIYFDYHSGCNDIFKAIISMELDEKDNNKNKEKHQKKIEQDQAYEEFIDDKPEFMPGEVKEKKGNQKNDKNKPD
jgi:hypothetical protein